MLNNAFNEACPGRLSQFPRILKDIDDFGESNFNLKLILDAAQIDLAHDKKKSVITLA